MTPIKVHLMNGELMWLNADYIESIRRSGSRTIVCTAGCEDGYCEVMESPSDILYQIVRNA